MSRLVEASGAQVLPPSGDRLRTVPVWVAQLCVDADLRNTRPIYAEQAAELVVVR